MYWSYFHAIKQKEKKKRKEEVRLYWTHCKFKWSESGPYFPKIQLRV